MADNDVTKMKVADLKKELKLRGLNTTGNKIELAERLQAALIDGDVALDDSALNSEDILDEDVLNDDELDDETKSLLDSNHEDAVLKTPPDSVKSKSPDTPADAIVQKKVVLKRKLTVSLSINDNTTNTPAVTELTDASASKVSKTSISAPSAEVAAATVGADVENENEAGSPDKKLVKLSELSAKERLEMRAKKFGAPIALESLKMARSERFGKNNSSAVSGSTGTGTEQVSVDVLKKRAERFGGSVSKVMNKIENLEKLQKRQERFGKGAANKIIAAPSVDFAEKARMRLQRFKSTVK